MKFPSPTNAVNKFEKWALPPQNGLKNATIAPRYADPMTNTAYQGFMQCFAWLESEFKKQQGTNTPDVLQNAKLKIETIHAPTGEQKNENWKRIHFVKLGDKESLDAEGLDFDETVKNLVEAWRSLVDKKPSAAANPLESQVGGSHYKSMAIQPIEFSMRNNLDPCQHTAIKYIARFRDKGGIADLDKAIHTIELLKHFESLK